MQQNDLILKDVCSIHIGNIEKLQIGKNLYQYYREITFRTKKGELSFSVLSDDKMNIVPINSEVVEK